MAVGRLLAGRYLIQVQLGEGGMGRVWRAEDQLLHRPVAVKQLIVQAAGPDDPAVARVLREARIAAQLDHPNAVPVHDVVLEDGEPFLVMGFVAGESLAGWLRRSGVLPPETVARVLCQVADALAAAHELGIVHRDVKPANILITPKGVARLADFGIARASADVTLTATGVMIGSVAFMAPEVALGDAAGPASDIWSLGATFFNLVSGRPPFDEQNTPRLLLRLVSEAPPYAAAAGPFADLVDAMLRREPAGRPTAEQVAAALRSPLPPASATVVEPVPTEWHEAPATVIEAPATTFDDPESTLIAAILHADELTGGWSGDVEDWADLIDDAVLPALGFRDRVDLVVPSMFGLPTGGPSGGPSGGLPRQVARSLRSTKAGLTLTLADRVLFAWQDTNWAAKAYVQPLEGRRIVSVGEGTYELDGNDFAAIEVVSDHTWPVILAPEVAGSPLRAMLVARLRGDAVPQWSGGDVLAWVDRSGRPAFPGWQGAL